MKKKLAVLSILFAVFVALSLSHAAGDFNKPTGSSLRTNFMAEIRDMFADQAKLFNATSTTNYPTGAVRYNGSTYRFEKYNGATWDALTLSGQDAGTVDNKNPGSASGLATLNGSSLVVENPASKGQTSGLAELNSSGTLSQNAPSGFLIGGNTPWTAGNTITGEASAKASSSSVGVDLGTVSTGDRIFVQGHVLNLWTVNPTYQAGKIWKGGGTATIQMDHDITTNHFFAVEQTTAGTWQGSTSMIVKVTGGGTLNIAVGTNASGGTILSYESQVYMFFLKKI